MIELDGVGMTLRPRGGDSVVALREVSLRIGRGELVAVTGPSGSGASTLLNLMGGLDLPTSGRCRLDGVDLSRVSRRRLTRLRGDTVGYVFPTFALMPELTVRANVELPLLYTRRRSRRTRARRALDLVGMGRHEGDMPVELTEAQRRKVLLARALINDPPVLLDDEPTRDLDVRDSPEVMELLTRLAADGRTVVFTTLREETAAWAPRVLRLESGRLVSDGRPDGTPFLRAV